MAITGKFVADFTDFDRGVQGAVPKLLTFQAAADKAGGRLMDLGQKGQDAAPKIGGLSSTLRTFDGALASMGIHIGPEIKALGELGEASGKAASQLGLVTTAGFAIAAGIGGWKIGRLIAEFTGSDKAIGDWLAHALGWSDALERAGAKADVLARASKTAGHEITSFAEALKINATAAADQGLAWGRSANAARDTAVAVSGWQKEIRGVRSRGDFEQLTADLDAQNFSIEKLSLKYGIHVEALQYLSRNIAATAKAQAEADDYAVRGAAAVVAAQKEAEVFRGERWKQQLEMEVKILAATQAESAARLALTNDAVLKELAAKLENNKAIEVEITAIGRLETAQKELQKTKIAGFSTLEQEIRLMNTFGQEVMEAAIAEEKARFAAQGVNDEAAKLPSVADPAAASVLSLGASAQQAAGGFFSMTAELYDAIRAAQAADAQFGAATSGQWNPITGYGHRASGGPVAAGGSYMVGERGPELFRPSSSGSIIPNGAGGGITVIVQGSLLSTEAALARLVEAALVRARLTSGGRIGA